VGALGAVELVGGAVGLHVLGGGIGVGIGAFGAFALGTGDHAVGRSQEGGCDKGDGEDVAAEGGLVRVRLGKLVDVTHSSWARRWE
jgi:hypothetical protein